MSAPPNTFAGAALDRAGARRRDAGWLQAARTARGSRAVLAGRAGVERGAFRRSGGGRYAPAR